MYVAHDSADVWSNRQFFLLDQGRNQLKIAGVPPDYFSATGQCRGNPIYNWPLLMHCLISGVQRKVKWFSPTAPAMRRCTFASSNSRMCSS